MERASRSGDADDNTWLGGPTLKLRISVVGTNARMGGDGGNHTGSYYQVECSLSSAPSDFAIVLNSVVISLRRNMLGSRESIV